MRLLNTLNNCHRQILWRRNPGWVCGNNIFFNVFVYLKKVREVGLIYHQYHSAYWGMIPTWEIWGLSRQPQVREQRGRIVGLHELHCWWVCQAISSARGYWSGWTQFDLGQGPGEGGGSRALFLKKGFQRKEYSIGDGFKAPLHHVVGDLKLVQIIEGFEYWNKCLHGFNREQKWNEMMLGPCCCLYVLYVIL